MDAVVLQSVDPTQDPRWAQLVRDRKTDVFHSPAWLRVLQETYGFPMTAALVTDGSPSPHAGFVYAEIDDLMDARIVSLPFSDFCDPLVADHGDWDRIVDALMTGNRRIHLRCLRSRMPEGDERFDESGRLLWHAIDTTRDPDTIWGSIDPSARRAIRKADRAGVQIRAADSRSDLRAFFDLHLRVRKSKYGLLAQPFSLFEHIWSEFLEPGAGVLLLASVGEEVAGGVLFLEWGDTLYYKFNASSPTNLAIRPNDSLVWAGIQEAQRRGLARLDFGVSDLDQPGLVRYKRKYATEESEVVGFVHRHEGSPSHRERSARNVLGNLTTLLVDPDVPDSITERAGEALYRYFT